MAEDPKKILAKSDEDLMVWTLSGEAGSYVHELGQTALLMRTALKNLQAAKDNLEATKSLVSYTKRIAVATWAVAAITLISQLALLLLRR